MPATTPFAAIKYALAADEIKAFPGETSEPGAKTIDKFLEEHTPTLKARAASFEAKSGELSECTKTLTVTLPSAAIANQLIWIFANPAAASEVVSVTTSGGAFLFGDFINKEATVKLAQNQHLLLQSNGTNWLIIAGEPKREQAVGGLVARTINTEYEPSATRPVQVMVEVQGSEALLLDARLTVGAGPTVIIGKIPASAGFSGVCAATFICLPGQKWKITGENVSKINSSYLTL